MVDKEIKNLENKIKKIKLNKQLKKLKSEELVKSKGANKNLSPEKRIGKEIEDLQKRKDVVSERSHKSLKTSKGFKRVGVKFKWSIRQAYLNKEISNRRKEINERSKLRSLNRRAEAEKVRSQIRKAQQSFRPKKDIFDTSNIFGEQTLKGNVKFNDLI